MHGHICNCSSNALLASAKKNPSVAKTLINEAISVAGCSEHEHLTLSAGTYLCISSTLHYMHLSTFGYFSVLYLLYVCFQSFTSTVHCTVCLHCKTVVQFEIFTIQIINILIIIFQDTYLIVHYSFLFCLSDVHFPTSRKIPKEDAG